MHTTTTPRAARGRVSTPCAHPFEMPVARPGQDRQEALLPSATEAWRAHVKARDAAARVPSRAKTAKAEAAFDQLIAVTDAMIEAPWPRTLDGLRALVEAVAMAHDGGCLDDADPAHRALRRLLSGCFMALGSVPPDGHAGL